MALTAYSMPVARLLDDHCELILVGDSLGMVLYGMPTTLGVTVDMMINHGLAVMRGAARACVVVDLPFGSYGASPEQGFRTAARIMAESGCSAVKLEGGAEMAPTIAFLVERGIPVVAHIGLTPQSVNQLGGFKVQGRGESEAQRIVDDALAVEAAGAFAVVIEGTVERLAREITARLRIPTIGIGASAACDGQILVTGRSGRHVCRVHAQIRQALCRDRQVDRGGRRGLCGGGPGPDISGAGPDVRGRESGQTRLSVAAWRRDPSLGTTVVCGSPCG